MRILMPWLGGYKKNILIIISELDNNACIPTIQKRFKEKGLREPTLTEIDYTLEKLYDKGLVVFKWEIKLEGYKRRVWSLTVAGKNKIPSTGKVL